MATARLGEYVLQQVLKEQALDVFSLSRKEWYSFTDGSGTFIILVKIKKIYLKNN